MGLGGSSLQGNRTILGFTLAFDCFYTIKFHKYLSDGYLLGTELLNLATVFSFLD